MAEVKYAFANTCIGSEAEIKQAVPIAVFVSEDRIGVACPYLESGKCLAGVRNPGLHEVKGEVRNHPHGGHATQFRECLYTSDASKW